METTTTITTTSAGAEPRIWLFNAPERVFSDLRRALYDKIKGENESRFGWGYDDRLNLNNFTHDDTSIQTRLSRLLDIKAGDYIAHINLPEQGKVTVVRVREEYAFHDKSKGIPNPHYNLDSEFRHSFSIEVVADAFDRDDVANAKILMPRHRLQEVRCALQKKAFFDIIREKGTAPPTPSDLEGRYRLVKGIHASIENLLRNTYPGPKLVELLEDIFNAVPNATAEINGDSPNHGAHIFVVYENPFLDVNLDDKYAIHVKPHEGTLGDLSVVDRVAEAVAHYGDVSAGSLFTSGEPTEALLSHAQKRSKEIGKRIAIVGGNDFFEFVLAFSGTTLYYRQDQKTS